MTWRRAALAVLFSPILIGTLLFVSVLIVWKLPATCCERLRAVRYLPLAGLCYYSVAVTVAAVSLRLDWWEVSLLAGFAVLGGDWLLLDPFSVLFRRARYRAVVRAVEFVERQKGPRAIYGMVAVVGSEPGRHIVSVAVEIGCTPPGRRLVSVSADGSVEELDFEQVAAAHGVRPWL